MRLCRCLPRFLLPPMGTRLIPPPFRHPSRRTSKRICWLFVVGIAVLGGVRWLGVPSPDPLLEARALLAAGDARRCLRLAQESLDRRPGDPDAALLVARAANRLGLVRMASIHYRLAGSQRADRRDLQDHAYLLATSAQPDEAAAVYEALLQRWPNDALALKRLAAVRMAQRDWRSVLVLAERLLDIPGSEVAGSTLAAIAHHESKRYSQAVAASQRVLELDPELVEMPLPKPLFWNNFALDLMAVGSSEEAERWLRKALESESAANLWELLGLSLFQQGSTDEAERCWREAVRQDPANANAWLGLGRLALGRRDGVRAIEFFHRAVEAAPLAVEPHDNLGRAYRTLGDADQARQWERKAAELRATRPITGGMGALPEDFDRDRVDRRRSQQ
jgi:tetratricopeptide (TPR) repeat protein